MKKIVIFFVLITACVLLTGCTSNVTDMMGKNFETIEQDECITICYDKNTQAVYIVYKNPHHYGISPYIMFDKTGRPTIGKWNGKEIIPAE